MSLSKIVPDYVVGLGRNIIGDICDQFVSKFLGLRKDHVIIMINCELTMKKYNEIFLKVRKMTQNSIRTYFSVLEYVYITPYSLQQRYSAKPSKTLLERCKCLVTIELYLQRSRWPLNLKTSTRKTSLQITTSGAEMLEFLTMENYSFSGSVQSGGFFL